MKPGEVVQRMGMVQAQDYLGALWAVGLRTPGATEADIEQAIAERQFVRTWPARGTLHFVAAQDVRWMLALLAPRAVQGASSRHRQLGLDEETFARSRKRITQVLRNGNRMTREALYQAMESSGISPEGQRGIHILGRLAQEGLICFGPRDGKQQVFVLLEEWLPAASDLPGARDLPGTEVLPPEQALAELARRYFTSHGPATVKDFAWWSGLTVTKARAGLEMAGPHLAQVEMDGIRYWGPPSAPAKVEPSRVKPSRVKPSPAVHLLPAFEEYLLGYTDRSAVLEPGYAQQKVARNGILRPIIVIDGQVVGAWKRALKKETVIVTPTWFAQPDEACLKAFRGAVVNYGEFLGLEAVLG
jgi:hypothetical protein